MLIGKLCRTPSRKENENAGGLLITRGGSKHQSEFDCVVHWCPCHASLGPVCEAIVVAGPDVP